MKRCFILCWFLFSAATAPAAGTPTNTISPTDYAAFKIIADRNIFNSRRRAGVTNSAAPTKPGAPAPRTESFALVGTMRYEKGYFAFFDGSVSEYRKVLKPEDTISGFKIKEVRPASVILQTATNEVDMHVGTQLSRADKGEWKLSERAENLEIASASSLRDRSSRGSRDLRRSEERPSETSNGSTDGSTFLDQILSAVDGTTNPPGRAITNAPGTPAGPQGDILEILRRRREQE